MKQIRIKNEHKALTLGQLRGAIAWVLRELGIEPEHARRWTVTTGYCRRGRRWSGTAYGYTTTLRFTTRPLSAVERARDVVGAAAHELWHLEQYRRGLWGPGAERTPEGKRRSVERGAEIARAQAEAAFDAQAAELAARWGFADPAAVALVPSAAPELEAARVAYAEAKDRVSEAWRAGRAHYTGCPCGSRYPRACEEGERLDAAYAAARDAYTAAGKRHRAEAARVARVASLDKARAARAKQAEAREQNARAKLVEWERKAAAARRKVAEWRARVRYYDRKAEAVDVAAGAAQPAAE